MNISLNFIPERSEQPRSNGITMVMDKGIGMNQTQDLVETAGNLIDLLKTILHASRLLLLVKS